MIETLRQFNIHEDNSFFRFSDIELLVNKIKYQLFSHIPNDYKDNFDININYLDILNKPINTFYENRVNVNYPKQLFDNIIKIEIKRFYPNVIKNLILNNIIKYYDDNNKIYLAILEFGEHEKLYNNFKTFLNYGYIEYIKERKTIDNAIGNILAIFKNKFDPIYMDTDTIYIKNYNIEIDLYFEKYGLMLEKSNIDFACFFDKYKYIIKNNGMIEYERGNNIRNMDIDMEYFLNQITTIKRDMIINNIIDDE